MSREDYLFDPSAEPDPEIAALEAALAPMRLATKSPSERVLAATPKRRAWMLLAPFAVVAAAATVAVWLWQGVRSDALRPGSAARSFVAEQAEVTVPLGDLAVITLQPGSELEFVHWREQEQALFRLKRGGMAAYVAPPPRVPAGFFVVESPRATVVDQGCEYELVIDAEGSTRVYVKSGLVTFADQERTVWVPAGARAVVGAEGVRTPTFVAAAPAVRKLVDRIDMLRHGKDPQRYLDSVRKLVRVCEQPGDTLPLWHLLKAGDLEVTKTVTEALFNLVGSPDGTSSIRMFPANEWFEHLRTVAW